MVSGFAGTNTVCCGAQYLTGLPAHQHDQ
jgi:hypothetical protein